MLKKIGRGLFLNDGSKLFYMSGDCFICYPNGRFELLLEFDLIENSSGKSIKIKKSLLCDGGSD